MKLSKFGIVRRRKNRPSIRGAARSRPAVGERARNSMTWSQDSWNRRATSTPARSTRSLAIRSRSWRAAALTRTAALPLICGEPRARRTILARRARESASVQVVEGDRRPSAISDSRSWITGFLPISEDERVDVLARRGVTRVAHALLDPALLTRVERQVDVTGNLHGHGLPGLARGHAPSLARAPRRGKRGSVTAGHPRSGSIAGLLPASQPWTLGPAAGCRSAPRIRVSSSPRWPGRACAPAARYTRRTGFEAPRAGGRLRPRRACRPTTDRESPR